MAAFRAGEEWNLTSYFQSFLLPVHEEQTVGGH